MAKYRKRPEEIEAIEFNRSNWEDVQSFTNNTAHTMTIERSLDGKCTCTLPTSEGDIIVNEGDFIIKGFNGGLYKVEFIRFNMVYELIKE